MVNMAQPVSPKYLRKSRYYKSYWYLFIASTDRSRDIRLLKEVLFWQWQKRYTNDTALMVLVSGQPDYNFYRKIFGIPNSPLLILADQPISTYRPKVDFIAFKGWFFSEKTLGNDYCILRDILEEYHNVLTIHESFKSVEREILKNTLINVLKKVWDELKGFVTISIPEMEAI